MGRNGQSDQDQSIASLPQSNLISRNPGNIRGRAISSHQRKKISKSTTRARGKKRDRARKATQHRRHRLAPEYQIFRRQRIQAPSRVSCIQKIMKLISWNCRGLGGSIKVETLRNIINSEKPDILLIQETNMPKDEVLSRSSLFWKFSAGKAISSRGASGGVATFCREDKFNIIATKGNMH